MKNLDWLNNVKNCDEKSLELYESETIKYSKEFRMTKALEIIAEQLCIMNQ